jgi:hypothetical protein
MKYLALIAIVGAALMANGQAARPHGDAHTKNSASKATDATDTAGQTVTVANQQAPQRMEESHAAKSPSYFSRLFAPENLPTIALVLVGFAGIVVAIRTLRTVESQAGIMRGQLGAMRGQIAQMESSGEQTAELIRHAANQVVALTDAAQAAKETAAAAQISAMTGENHASAAAANAKAAMLNAQVALNAERPWIVTSAETKQTKMEGIFVDAITHGRTTANIVSQWAGYTIQPNEESLPDEPSYGAHGIKIAHPFLAFPDQRPFLIYQYPLYAIRSDATQWKRIIEVKDMLFVFGRLLYTDTLSKDAGKDPVVHETRWCYRYLPPVLPPVLNSPPQGLLKDLGSVVKAGKMGYNRYT